MEKASELVSICCIIKNSSQIKNIELAFQNATKVEKVRIANSVDVLIQKASGMGNVAPFETPVGLSVLSLLLAGKEVCTTDAPAVEPQPNFIEQMDQESERERIRKEQEERDRADMQCAIEFDGMKNKIRAQYEAVTKALEEVHSHGGDKKVREAAEKICNNALSVLTEDFQQHVDTLSAKDKFKQSAAEGTQLAQKLRDVTAQLRDAIAKAKEDNKFFARIGRFITDMVSE